MPKNNITLKELSSILGVSISTISKALNDSHEISEATKKRIKELAKLHNYQPNKIALGLKSGKTNTIAVVIPSVQNAFFARVLFGIEQVIAESNYNIIICITNESLDKEVENLRMLSNGVVDGFIIAVAEETQTSQNFSHFKEVLGRGKPIVMFDRVVESINCDKVMVDDFNAVFNATNHLIKSGKKKIVILSTINNLSVGKLRVKGYLAALNNAEGVGEPLIVEGVRETIDEKAKDVIQNHKVDAFIALDDFSSFAALKMAKLNGKQIPQEIAIIGYISERMANNVTPGLTTINQHATRLGKTTAKMMLDKLTSKSETIEHTVINSTLTLRATS